MSRNYPHKLNCSCCICKAKRGENYGKNNPFFGRQHTNETKKKFRLRKFSKEHKKKLSENHANFLKENNPAWQGGKSFEEYGEEFDSQLKEQVRFRDKYTCQLCGCSQLENRKQLDIHHKDYDKKNNKLNNLISLCHSCHSKTGVNRHYWTLLLKEQVYVKK